MKNQNYNVYTIYLKDNNQQLLKHFEKDFEAREFVRKQLENDLKIFYYQTSIGLLREMKLCYTFGTTIIPKEILS